MEPLPPPVFVSREDTLRMQLVLNQLASLERGKRVSESIGGIGFGALLGGAGIGLLHVTPDMTHGEKTEARVLGGVMLGLSGLFVVGGIGSLAGTGKSERAAAEFRQSTSAGGDSAQAFARADDVIIRLVKERRDERLAASSARSPSSAAPPGSR